MTPALSTAHENATAGILVVQARCLRPLPGEVPEGRAQLTPIAATTDPSPHQNSSIISAKLRRRISDRPIGHAA